MKLQVTIPTLALALLVYLLAWVGLTVLGAVIFNMEPDELWTFLGNHPPDAVTAGYEYWFFLLAPIVLVPMSAVIVYRASINIMRFADIRPVNTNPSRELLLILVLASFSYCFYKLVTTGHAIPAILFHSGDYSANIQMRAKMISDLRFTFYAILYAAIPVLSCLFFARWLSNNKKRDLFCLMLTFAMIYYLTLSVYMKAPFAVYFAMLTLTVITMRANLLWIPVLVIAALLTFGSMHALLGGVGAVDNEPTAAITATPAARTETPAIKNAPALPQFSSQLRLSFLRMPINMAYRMASSYPFYIGVSADTNKRCGIETNNLPLLPKPRCDLPSKVFASMYPSITSVVGMAPAAAHVSALGEAGPGWSVIVLILSGASIGFLSAVAKIWQGTIGVGLSLAVCVYAYYLTQVPLIGALSYSHGLLFFLFPLAIIIAIDAMRHPARYRAIFSLQLST